jgi:hypothetical protein
MTGRYRVNAPQVINEVIDGEAVVIHLGTGDYFSLRGSGAYVWQALDAGAQTSAIVAAFTDAGLGASDQVEPAVLAIIDLLLAEALIVPDDEGGPDPALGRPEGSSFESPELEKFTDMQDLILLDPVHEVDERGWPHAAPQS